MLTSDQIEALGDKAQQITSPIVEFLIENIARRVSEAGQLTSTASYQVWRLQQLGMSQRQLKKELRKRLKVSHRELRKLLTQSAEVGYNFDIKNLPYVQAVLFSKNDAVQQIVSSAVQMAQDDLTNMVQTLGFVAPNGKAAGLTDAYQQACDFAFQKVATGAQDYNSAIRQATKGLAERGIVTIDYESGVSTSLEAAVRRNVMGGLGLMQERISQQNHDDLGCDGWEISAHAASAPDHEPIQGKQYSDAQYTALNNSLVRRIGTLNCGHAAFPIILGVNSPQYSAAELEQFRRDNEKGIEYEGKHYTTYEATQRQRKLERAIRKQKRRILIDEKLGDKEQLAIDQTKLVCLSDEYARFTKAAKLRSQRERANIPGFGPTEARAAERGAKEYQNRKDSMARLPKKTVDKKQESGIMDAGNINRVDIEEGRTVQRLISNVLKTDANNIKLDELPVQAQRYILAATRKVTGKFPQLKGYTREIVYAPGIDAVARSRSITGILEIGPDFMDLEKLQRTFDDNVKWGFWTKGTKDVSSLIIHEYGHQLDGYLTRKGVYGASISKYGVERTSVAVQKEVLRRAGMSDERLREIRKEWSDRGYEGKDLSYAVRWERKEFISNNLSEYATTNEREFFAEAFTEYMVSDEPREIARIFGEVLEEIMEGI